MRLTFKLILATVLIVALSVSLCATVLLSGSFQTELNAQYESAMQESALFCASMGSMAVQFMNADFRADARDGVEAFLKNGVHLKNYAYQILDGEGNVLAASKQFTPQITAEEVDTGHVVAHVFRQGPRYVMETFQQLLVDGQPFTVHLFRDVTGIFDTRDQNLHISYLAIFGALAVSTVVIVLVSLYFVSPIRRLSRTTRQMAQGQYSRRALVTSHDELGELAVDFNRMADTVEQQISQLEDNARHQRDFTASFAHEIKTPLTSVIGYADTMRSRELPREQQLRAANYIFSEGKRMEAMSLALLDLFSLERATPELKPVKLDQVAAAVAESSRFRLREKHMQLQLDVEPAEIQGEPTLLHNLLYNLVDNARKASADGAVVELVGRRMEQNYCFQIRDHGRGIPKESLVRLTEPFYMVDKSRARAEGGAGLGLSIAKRIVEVHSGRLLFESTEGQGTTVTVELGGVL